MPKHIVSDRGSLFTSKFWGAMCHYLNVTRRLSTAFHPQTDGQTERQNQVLEHYLRTYVNFEQDDWTRWLSLAQHTYNNSKHSVTGTTPLEMLCGFRSDLRVNLPEEKPKVTEERDAHQRVDDLRRMREMLRERLEAAKKAQATQYNKRHMDITFKVGDLVMLRSINIKSPRESRKLDVRQIGPFFVTATWGKNAYQLKLPPKYRDIHPVFHVSLLEPYYARAGKPVPPEPDYVEGEKEYVIKEIVRDRTYRKQKQYLVRWEGYPPEEDT
jgi:Chromo (CHRromatin Organisation MOdifier) domain